MNGKVVSSYNEDVILSLKDVTLSSKDVKRSGSRAVQMLLSRYLFAVIPLVRTFDLGYRIFASSPAAERKKERK